MADQNEKNSGQSQIFNFDYEHTVMYGRYHKSLASAAREMSHQPSSARCSSQRTPASFSAASKQSTSSYQSPDGKRFDAPSVFDGCKTPAYPTTPGPRSFSTRCRRVLSYFSIENLGEDWIFLALLGVLMALISFTMDICADKLLGLRTWLYALSGQVQCEELWPCVALQFVVWVGFMVILVLLSAAIMLILSPQAIGSGIPEIKTIMRGVILKEYLSFRTLIAKILGLTLALGSGIPIGKEGPSVHIASIVAALLSKMVKSFRGIYENESRSGEMLAAAVAVGVGCTFGAPIGGVLFSIEVTSVYFAVRNYWRAFFAATCSAACIRFLSVWVSQEAVMMVAFYKTNFSSEIPFNPWELIPFFLIGLFCGLAGVAFIKLHRAIVTFIRRNSFARRLLGKNRLLYPFLVTFVIASLTFPPALGQFLQSNASTQQIVRNLFSEYSWVLGSEDEAQNAVIRQWGETSSMIYGTLAIFAVNTFWMSVISNTLPIPTGSFVPLLMIGATFGRLMGEFIAYQFPNGLIMLGKDWANITPGAYAVVGGAALCGAVTRTISVSVILFEMTGQLVYLVPIMMAVLVANAVCSCFESSIYDSMIKIKHLPYLPDMLPTSSVIHKIFVEEFMVHDVKFICCDSTYADVQSVLNNCPELKAFPLVDASTSMILIGSVPRAELELALDQQIGDKVRRREAWRRHFHRSSMFLPSTISSAKFSANFNQLPILSVGSAEQNPRTDSFGVNETPSKASRFVVDKVSPIDDLPAIETSPKAETKFPAAATSFRKQMSNTLHLSDPKLNEVDSQSHSHGSRGFFGGYLSSFASKLKLFPSDNDIAGLGVSSKIDSSKIDLIDDEKQEWETERLAKKVDFANVQLDPSPFQLNERTSLYKVHSLFSLLGINHAYVTTLGRLIGVVALRELRFAIESANINGLPFTPYFSPTMDAIERSVRVADIETGVVDLGRANEGAAKRTRSRLNSDTTGIGYGSSVSDVDPGSCSRRSVPNSVRQRVRSSTGIPDIQIEFCDDNIA